MSQSERLGTTTPNLGAREGDGLLAESNVNRRARSSLLRITDVRTATLRGVPFLSHLVRIDTNQGIVGYGEVRDGASKNYALMLKRHLLGENPCDVERLFRKISQFGGHARQGGGVSGIEMALWDLAGKAYDVPVYALLGGKYRDEILCYADTPSCRDASEMGERLAERRERGFKWLKMDVGIDLLADREDMLAAPPGAVASTRVMHPFTGIQITRRGVDYLVAYVARVREIIGDETPLSIDHFGHIGLESCIRLARALEPFTPAWLEDMIPWQYTEQWRSLTDAVATPTCTGEDIYLAEGVRPLLERGAVRVIHPDPATAGGIAETKRIGDLAQGYGVPMALHLAASPVATYAAVHIAAATENFLVLEHHAADVEGWSGLVSGVPQPIIQNGVIRVPDAPGLGFEDVDEQACRAFASASDGDLFAPSSEWDGDSSHDRLWS